MMQNSHTEEHYRVMCRDCGRFPFITSDRLAANRRQARHESSTGHYVDVSVFHPSLV